MFVQNCSLFLASIYFSLNFLLYLIVVVCNEGGFVIADSETEFTFDLTYWPLC